MTVRLPKIVKGEVAMRLEGKIVNRTRPKKICTFDGIHGVIVKDGRDVTKEGDVWVYEPR